MEKLLIKGGNQLKGKISCSGAKNAALPIIAASILSDEKIVLKNPFLSPFFFYKFLPSNIFFNASITALPNAT